MLNLIIVHLFGLMTPGPDFFYVSRMAASNSRRNTVCGILGITLGIAFWGMLSMLGLAVLFVTIPALHDESYLPPFDLHRRNLALVSLIQINAQ